MKIYNKSSLNDKILKEAAEIFFQTSSRKNFSDEDEKNEFLNTWMDYYLNHKEAEFLYVLNDENKVLGYLTGAFNSTEAIDYFSNKVSSYELFKDLFLDFPAHLHINMHESARGLGFGSLLINHFCELLQEQNITGVHIVTIPDSMNVKFYLKNNFSVCTKREFRNKELLFMGRFLAPLSP